MGIMFRAEATQTSPSRLNLMPARDSHAALAKHSLGGDPPPRGELILGWAAPTPPPCLLHARLPDSLTKRFRCQNFHESCKNITQPNSRSDKAKTQTQTIATLYSITM